MGKFTSFFSKNSFKRNLTFLIVEGVLIVAVISSGFVALGSIGAIKTTTTPKSLSVSNSRVASPPEEAISLTEYSIPPFIQSEEMWGASRQNPRANDEYEIPVGVTYDKDDFLPKTAEPAPVLDTWIRRGLSNEEELMFTSLQGLVNSRQPRIYTSPADPKETGTAWQNILNIKFNKPGDPYELINKYKDEIRGWIVYDDSNITVIDTANLACTMASVERGVAISPKLLDKVAKFNLPIIADLRGEFNDKWEIYEWMFDNYASRTSDKAIIGINPNGVYGFVRDYAMAVKACIIWLDPVMAEDCVQMDKYMKRMVQDGATYLGWWPQEQEGVMYAADFGVVTLAADWSQNLSYFSGSRTKPLKQKDGFVPLTDAQIKAPKVYVAFLQSDGDNMQYMQGRMLSAWLQEERGEFPLAWTTTPCAAVLAPDIWNFYAKSMNASNDMLVSGPSGFGYFYPQRWVVPNEGADRDLYPFVASPGLAKHINKTDKLMGELGMKTITVWNSSDGAMTRQTKNGVNYLQFFADNMPSIMGITQQEYDLETEKHPEYSGPALKWDFTDSSNVYKSRQQLDWRHQNIALLTGKNGNKFMSHHLAAAYDESADGLKFVARKCIQDWDGKSPLYIGLQGVPWAELGGMTVFQGVQQYINLLTPSAEFIRVDQMLDAQKRLVENGYYKQLQDANR